MYVGLLIGFRIEIVFIMKLPKFYRYLIYRFYTWRIEKKDDTPIASIVFSMSFIHSIQFIILLLIIGKFIPKLNSMLNQPKWTIIIFFALFNLFYYLIIYNQKRWNQYIDEFKMESVKERKKGIVMVLLFTFGSVILLFAVLYTFIFI